ncbi:hypothetical protein BD408DRAFT_479563 [Parasitella parasitica]|nr:hypothetical protein BD408DRAFT_479563 [Parasitella parasitica]
MSCPFASLIEALDVEDMKNKDQYKRAISISQRIQSKIKKLNDDRTRYKQSVAVKTVKDDVGDDQDNILSPTETIIAYCDDNHSAGDRDKPLPLIQKHASFTLSKKPLPPLYIHTGFDSAVELSTFAYTNKSLPPIASPLTFSPCSESSPGPPLTPPPPPSSSPLPTPTKKDRLPTIQHFREHYCRLICMHHAT